MKLKVGKTYIDNSGFTVGPMLDNDNDVYPFKVIENGDEWLYKANGKSEFSSGIFSLVKEHPC